MSKALGVAGLVSALSFSPSESFSQNDKYDGFLKDSVEISHSVKDPDNDSFPEKTTSKASHNGEDYVVLKKEDKNNDGVYDYATLYKILNRFDFSKEGIKKLSKQESLEISLRNDAYLRDNISEIFGFDPVSDSIDSYFRDVKTLAGLNYSLEQNGVSYDSLSDVKKVNYGLLSLGSQGEDFESYTVDDYKNRNTQKLDDLLRNEFYKNAFIDLD